MLAGIVQELEELDAHARFELIKARFFAADTHMNDPEEEEEDGKDASHPRPTRQGSRGILPTRLQLERSIQELMRRQTLREDKLRELKEEKREEARRRREAGLSSRSSLGTDSSLDYAVEMQEERFVPEGQEALPSEYEGTGQTKRTIKAQHQPKLLKLRAEAVLPRKLPDCIVYWNRLQVRVESSRHVTLKRLADFRQQNIRQFVDEDAAKEALAAFPRLKDKEMWMDPQRDAFTNPAEEAIFKSREWPRGLKEYDVDGYMKFERVRGTDVFFNSAFESGNLRQAFRVPYAEDFEEVEVEPEVPDFLPEDDQREQRQRIADRRARLAEERQARLDKEDAVAEDGHAATLARVAREEAERAAREAERAAAGEDAAPGEQRGEESGNESDGSKKSQQSQGSGESARDGGPGEPGAANAEKRPDGKEKKEKKKGAA